MKGDAAEARLEAMWRARVVRAMMVLVCALEDVVWLLESERESPAPPNEGSPAGPAVDVPAVLRDPRARRMRQCLAYIGDRPGASNRQVATAIGVASHTQMSALLARLERMGLVRKRVGGPGRPNAWWLTHDGLDVASALRGERGCDKAHVCRSAQACGTSQVPIHTVV